MNAAAAAQTSGAAPQQAIAPGAVLAPGQATHVVLAARQSFSVEVQGPANGLAPLEIRLGGGLLAVTSPGLPKCALELGKGGRLVYVVQLGADGRAAVRLDSGEQQRTAELDVVQRGTAASPELALRREAEAALITADSARKHLPGAPAPEAALAGYERAARLAEQLPDSSLERFALAQQARYLAFGRSDVAAALTLLEKAAALPGTGSDGAGDAFQALTLKSLSSVEEMLGNTARAIEDGERALALYRVAGDLYWQGIVLGNLGSDYAEAGDYARASAAVREGMEDAETMQDGAGVVFCLSQLAGIERQRGDFQAAFQAFRDALAWGDRIHYAPLIEAEIEKEQGVFYAQLGMWSEASAALEQCLLHVGGIDNAISLEAREVLARGLFARRRYAEAAHAYDEATAAAGRLKLPREEALLLLGRASALDAEGKGTAARTDLDRAAAIAEELGSPALRVRVELTRAAVAKTPAAALTHFATAAVQAHANGQREEEAAALAGEAHALDLVQRAGDRERHSASGEQADPLTLLRQAIALIEQSRSSLDSQDLAASYFTEHHLWYEWAITIAMHQAQPDVRAAFLLSEQARARSMLDSLEQRAWGPALQLPPELAGRSARNREAIARQEALLGGRVADLNAAAATLRRLYEEQDALDGEQRAYARRGGGQVTQESLHRSTASVEDVQQALLAPGTAMVSFSLGPTESFRWLLTTRGVQVARLPGRAALERSLSGLLDALARRRSTPAAGEDMHAYAGRQQRFLAARDHELDRAGSLLLGGLPRHLSRLYVVGEGALLNLPWAALGVPCEAGRCRAIERFEVVTEPSASVALALAETAPPPAETPVLVLADPSTAPASSAWTALPPLEAARQEAAGIRQYTPPPLFHLLAGEKATPTALLAALSAGATTPHLGVLHLAAHTVLVPQHPELSGIALAPEKGRAGAAEGILWLRDISSMQAPPLVVLSGCQTQGGSRLAGEALESLSQAFFFAGAHGVVASLWSVDDASTAELMRDFYRNLLEQHKSAPAALRAAELAMLRSGDDVSSWAPFVFTGVAQGRPAAQASAFMKASAR